MSEANERQVAGEHYRSPIQHWDYVLANNIPYLEAQIIKYVTRHRRKGGLTDLEKASHFLQKLIEEETKRKASEDEPDLYEAAAQNRLAHQPQTIVQDGHGFGHVEYAEQPVDPALTERMQ